MEMKSNVELQISASYIVYLLKALITVVINFVSYKRKSFFITSKVMNKTRSFLCCFCLIFVLLLQQSNSSFEWGMVAFEKYRRNTFPR